MNRKYKIIFGVVCVLSSIILGYIRLSHYNEGELITGASSELMTDEDSTPKTPATVDGTDGYEPDTADLQSTYTKDPGTDTGVNDTDIMQELVVHVCGCVKEPGVYSLDPGSRIMEAVDMAGGFTDEADSDVINLADRLTDGMQIYVPAASETGTDPDRQYIKTPQNVSDVPATAVSGSDRININTASKEELMTLNGVGASRAEAIIAYRAENGCFDSIEEIMNISGIKDGLFGKIKDKITVE